jgi:hypothetical protein
VAAAGAYAQRLLSIDSDGAPRVAAWGRELGQLAKSEGKPFPSLRLALRQLGDRFLVRIQNDVANRKRERALEAKQARARLHSGNYQRFLAAEELRYRTERPQDYARFISHREAQRAEIIGSRLWGRDPKWLQLYDSEQRRNLDFQEFFALPDFWTWDSTINPNPLKL